MEVVLTQCKEEICIVAVVKGQKELAGDRKLMENFKDFCTIYHLGEREKLYQIQFLTHENILNRTWRFYKACGING